MRFVRGHNRRGEHHTPEAVAAIRATKQEDAHPHWAGESVGYSALHNWVRKKRPYSGQCQSCGVRDRRTENANISGDYRRDVDDFIELCVPCHKDFDGARA